MQPPRYSAERASHVLLNRSRNGERILLEDRSVWRIDPGEAARTRRWPQWTRVRVAQAGGNAHWLSAEILGQRECVLGVYTGTLPYSVMPVPAEPAVVEQEI